MIINSRMKQQIVFISCPIEQCTLVEKLKSLIPLIPTEKESALQDKMAKVYAVLSHRKRFNASQQITRPL